MREGRRGGGGGKSGVRWMSRAGAVLVLAALGLGLVMVAPAPAAAVATTVPGLVAPVEETWSAAPTVKRFFRSHTSYEFGDPFDRRISPLSRLEFPLNSWWGGVRLGALGPRFSFDLELLAALPGQDDIGAMRDSDWENGDHSQVKTTYSESKTRLKQSFNLDAKAGFSLRESLGLPAWLDLRPLLGVRWQRFTFVAHDGWQENMESDGTWNAMALPGDGIWFRQEYIHAYGGLLLTADLARLGLGRPGHGWRASLQGDLAQVWGQNRDRHLLRGDRETRETTQGYAWHTALSLHAPLWSWGSLALTGEYMFITSKGDHTWDDPPTFYEHSDYGVRVWSQQMSLSLALEIPF